MSQLQPLGVCVNKPFKYYIREKYENWLHLDNHALTTSKKVKKASASTIVKWVSAARKSAERSNKILI